VGVEVQPGPAPRLGDDLALPGVAAELAASPDWLADMAVTVLSLPFEVRAGRTGRAYWRLTDADRAAMRGPVRELIERYLPAGAGRWGPVLALMATMYVCYSARAAREALEVAGSMGGDKPQAAGGE
jgi:hypothetical protein